MNAVTEERRPMPQGEQQGAGRKAVLLSLVTDLIAPLAVFYGLRAAGVDQWWALLGSAVVPLAVVVHRLVTTRRVEWFALFVLTVFALGLVLSALTGDPRTMLVRDAWAGMIGGLAGVWMLGSVLSGRRPALMLLFRNFVIAKVGPQGAAAWDARWDREPDFRHGIRVLTALWGLAGLLNALLNLAFAYVLPLDAAPAAMHAVWPALAVPLGVFHLVYTKRKNLRA
ncbi:VC0807 family protein [Actinomadura rupiterrae]|uniref:VC0807 family protein n=1 Tax=Actinomadura rupiterrae TaxID=559627 RepID=UPI0020A58F4B|nr:VC0807 family protein [Actinomadura rupiterrae]MCP2341359.1 hypothetical protein [Actinomadura rupiterrae]